MARKTKIKIPDTITSDWYQNVYLNSPHWRKTRDRAVKHHGGWCRICGDNKKLVVHHVQYRNLGKEHLGDFVILCCDCHQLAHVDNSGNKIDLGRKKIMQKRVTELQKKKLEYYKAVEAKMIDAIMEGLFDETD